MKAIIRTSVILIITILSMGCVSTATTQLESVKQKEGVWKGLNKTTLGTYIPDSFDSLYKILESKEYYKEGKDIAGNSVLYTEDEIKALIAKKNLITKQSYPKQAMLSPYQCDGTDSAYANGILFIPSTTLEGKSYNELGLTKQQYLAIQKDIKKYERKIKEEDLPKDKEIEVMEISCRLEELPFEIQTITELPVINDQYLPIVEITDEDMLKVNYRKAVITNLNSQYLYATDEIGNYITYDGSYDLEGKETQIEISKEQVKDIVYLFFIYNRTIEYKNEMEETITEAYYYLPKLVVFHITD